MLEKLLKQLIAAHKPWSWLSEPHVENSVTTHAHAAAPSCDCIADCVTERCTTDGSNTATNYYYDGAYKSCGPRNMGCYQDRDCFTNQCIGGTWGPDSPDSTRTAGQCVKAEKDQQCDMDADCKSNRCTTNFPSGTRTCAG